MLERIERYLEGKNQENKYQSVIYNFVLSIQPLPIPEDSISGNVAVLGGGPVIPERALLCTQESDFKAFHRGISHVSLVDPDLFTRPPQYYFELPIEYRFRVAPEDLKERLLFYNYSGQEILSEYSDNFFHLITFFRNPDFAEQLNTEFLTTLGRVIEPGGYFIGSGSSQISSWNVYTEDRLRELVSQYGFSVQSYTRLADWDFDFPFQRNIGIVLQKL